MIAVWVWVGVSAVGLLASIYLTNESRLDLVALDENANGRRTAAWSRMIREGMRISVHLVWLVAGLTVLDILPLPRAIVVPALIWGNIALLINSLIDAHTRRLLFATRGPEPPITH